jgi:hypothetical protein
MAIPWIEEKIMPDDLPSHVKADIARKDALVLDLCTRLGFEFVMESASRQWSKRAPRKALKIERPTSCSDAAAPDDRPRGMAAITAAITALDALATGGGIRQRVQASETLDQLQAFVKAAGARTITGAHPGVAADFAYDASTRTLVVEGLDFPLTSLNASHGRLYSNPYDEAKTVHTLSLYDGAAGAEMRLALS